MARAIDTASVSASMVTARATGRVLRTASGDRSGAESPGSEAGSVPTIAMPVVASPKAESSSAAMTLPTIIATIM